MFDFRDRNGNEISVTDGAELLKLPTRDRALGLHQWENGLILVTAYEPLARGDGFPYVTRLYSAHSPYWPERVLARYGDAQDALANHGALREQIDSSADAAALLVGRPPVLFEDDGAGCWVEPGRPVPMSERQEAGEYQAPPVRMGKPEEAP